MSITQTIPLYSGNVPNRSSGAGTFSDDADAWIAYQAPLAAAFNTFAGQVNTTRNQINSRANQVAQDTVLAQSAGQAATSIANFKGAWSGLTGALNVPASVLHRGNYWALLSNTGSVQNIEPGVSSQWSLVPVAGYSAFVERINSKSTLIADFVRNQHRVYEQYGLTDKAITDVLDTTRDSTATYDSPFGVATAGVNEPRITYDPETGKCLGLLSQMQRVNFITHNKDLNESVWLEGGSVSRTNNTLTATSVFSNINKRPTVSVGNYTATVSVDYITSENVRCVFFDDGVNITVAEAVVNPLTGAIVSSSGTVNKRKTRNGIEVYLTGAVTNGNVRIYCYPDSLNGTGSCEFVRAQLESGLSATADIPTGASAETRGADNNTMPIIGGNIAGTIAFKDVDFKPSGAANEAFIGIRLNNDNEFYLRRVSTTSEFRIGARVAFDTTNLITNVNITELKSLVMSWERTATGYRFKAATNLNILATVDIATANDIDFNVLGIFQRGNNSLHGNGTVGEIYMSPRMLPDSELIALIGGN